MYILLALIAACAFGIIVHYLMIPHHDLRGTAVAPAVATATAGAVYAIGQWAGLSESSPRLWLLSLGAAAALSVAVTLVLTLVRVRGDGERRAALGI
jgi:anti-sigma factor RsiW